VLRHQSAEAISLAPVSWNMSNPMFKTSKNDHVIEVKLYDDIDFVCPYYPQQTTSATSTSSTVDESSLHHQLHEYYVIYMVNRAEYRDCNIYDDSNAVMMLNCSNPRHRKRFTILFEPFQSIPNVPEYHPGRTYYFITTSTGSRHGLSNLYQGACSHHNMKLTVKVCCETTTVKPLKTNTLTEYKLPHVTRVDDTWLIPDSNLAPSSEYTHSVTSHIGSAKSLTKTGRHQPDKARLLTVTTLSTAAGSKTVDKFDSRYQQQQQLASASEDIINSVAKLHIEDFSNAKHAGLVTNNSCQKLIDAPQLIVCIVAVVTVIISR
jgi:hypothetical protein